MGVPRNATEAAALLGVPVDAAEGVVEERFRRLAQVFHPDLNPGVVSCGERMQELNAARELLAGGRRPAEVVVTRPDRRERAEGQAPARQRSKKDEERLRRVMHEMPYGIYIVGSRREEEPNGMIADWVMQVSFRPRLLAVSFENDAYSLENVRRHNVFTVNLLPQGAMELGALFLQPRDGAKIAGRSAAAAATVHEKLAGAAYRLTERGCPVLEGALTWVECAAERFVSAGDHTLVIGEVLDGEVLQAAGALTSVETGWVYGG